MNKTQRQVAENALRRGKLIQYRQELKRVDDIPREERTGHTENYRFFLQNKILRIEELTF